MRGILAIMLFVVGGAAQAQPGELAQEIEAGYWHVADADPGLFWQHNDTLWEDLLARLANGHAPQRGAMYSVSLESARRL